MLFKQAVVLAFIASASAGLVRRDATTVLNDLKTVDTDVNTLKTDVNGLSNPATGAQIIKTTADSNTLNKALQQGTSDCSATTASSVTTAQAQAIISYCQSPLLPDVTSLVSALISKKANLANVKSTVQQQLKYTQGNTTALTNCLLSKVPASPTTLKPAASSCVSSINAQIASAVAAYA